MSAKVIPISSVPVCPIMLKNNPEPDNKRTLLCDVPGAREFYLAHAAAGVDCHDKTNCLVRRTIPAAAQLETWLGEQGTRQRLQGLDHRKTATQASA